MNKYIKAIISGTTILLLGLFFYSGFLFYQNNPNKNPFPEEGHKSAIADKEIITDQLDKDRLYGRVHEGIYRFSYKPMHSYAYYKGLALSNPAFIEMDGKVKSAVTIFDKDLENYKADASKKYEKLDKDIKEFKDNN